MAYIQKTPLFFQTTQSDGTVVKVDDKKKKKGKEKKETPNIGNANMDDYENHLAAKRKENTTVTDGGEAQDQDKIFNDKGEEIGHYEGGIKVMNNKTNK